MHLHARIGPALVAFAALSLISPRAANGNWGIGAAKAHSFIEVSVDFLSQKATRVVVAVPAEKVSLWESSDGATRIVTYHRLQVQSNIVGKGGSEIWVRTLGGSVGEIAQRVFGSAPVRKGEKAMLFLASRPDGNFAVLAREQGFFPVVAEKVGGKKKFKVMQRRITHAPVSRTLETIPASTLEGMSLEQATRVIVEARKRHVK